MSVAKKIQANRSPWITVAAVFLVFQAAGAVGHIVAGLYFWLPDVFPVGYELSDFALWFIPPLLTTLIFVGLPLFFLYRTLKLNASTSVFAYVLIAQFLVQFVFLVVFVRVLWFAQFPFPSAGILGMYGEYGFGIPLYSPVELLVNPLFDLATATNLGYLVLGVGLLSTSSSNRTSAPSAALSASKTKVSRASNQGEWYTAQIPFYDEKKLTFFELQELAKQKVIQPETVVRMGTSKGKIYPAMMIPGVFSDKSATTALILGLLVGFLGIDRFYLGYTGLGILKLLTFGGCGIWSFIDVVLIALGKVPDSNGRPLR